MFCNRNEYAETEIRRGARSEHLMVRVELDTISTCGKFINFAMKIELNVAFLSWEQLIAQCSASNAFIE